MDINSEEEIKEPLLPKKEEIPRMIPAEVGLAYCNKLFTIEDELKDLSPEDRYNQRLDREKPVLEAYWSWVDSQKPVRNTQPG